MNSDKASVLMVFLTFFQACWMCSRLTLWGCSMSFTLVVSLKKLNATFLALIPKKFGAIDRKDFQPISLVSGVYKIIAKVLPNRLRKFVEKIISKSRNAFLQGRHILYYIFIANDCLDSGMKSDEPGVLCKLDIEKAYDHVNKDFLFYLLRRCGFGQIWCSWIARCISSVHFFFRFGEWKFVWFL
jgi:hypothetical protein